MPAEASEDGKDEIAELNDWIWDRVADDRDVVVDDMQEEFFPMLEKKDDEDPTTKGYNKKKQHFGEASIDEDKNMIECKKKTVCLFY